MEKNNSFKIKGLDLFYGDFQALKNVDLDIEKNKVTLCKDSFSKKTLFTI